VFIVGIDRGDCGGSIIGQRRNFGEILDQIEKKTDGGKCADHTGHQYEPEQPEQKAAAPAAGSLACPFFHGARALVFLGHDIGFLLSKRFR